MKGVEVNGRLVVVCNCEGRFYAFQRRCGHMNAPLELGTLDGTILTCPMHSAQFDVTTGEALAGPVPRDTGEIPPPRTLKLLTEVAWLMGHIETESLRTFETKVESGAVWVKAPRGLATRSRRTGGGRPGSRRYTCSSRWHGRSGDLRWPRGGRYSEDARAAASSGGS